MKKQFNYNSNNDYEKTLEVCQYIETIANDIKDNYFNRGIATSIVDDDLLVVATDDINELKKMYKDVKDEYFYIKKLNRDIPFGSNLNVTIDELMGLCDKALTIIDEWSKGSDLKKCTDEEIYLLESKLEDNYKQIKYTSSNIENETSYIINQVNEQLNSKEGSIKIKRLKKLSNDNMV